MVDSFVWIDSVSRMSETLSKLAKSGKKYEQPMPDASLMSIVPVDDADDPTLCAYLRIGDAVYPIASISHLTAPEDAQLAYRGPIYQCLYQENPLSPRQQALMRSTLSRNPRFLHSLYHSVSNAHDYSVLFTNLASPPARKNKRARA